MEGLAFVSPTGNRNVLRLLSTIGLGVNGENFADVRGSGGASG